MDKPHFLARRLQESQRRQARPYTCPKCHQDLSFASEAKLFEHTENQHASLKLNSLEDAAWRSFVSEAQRRANTRTFLRMAPDANLGFSKQSSHDSMEPLVGDVSRSRAMAPIQPSSLAMGDGNLDDIKKLSLTPSLDLARRPSSNPRKRSALQDPGHSHGRNLSGVSQSTKDPDFERTQPPQKKLFDPSGHETMSLRRGGAVTSGPAISYEDTIRQLRKSPGQTHSGIRTSPRKPSPKVHHVQRMPVTGDTLSEHTEVTHRTDDEPGDPYDQLGAEPELLLQPETRPISREQLVVEVKRIYSGLILVESKCIEWDEKQSADAQEKDPAKRPMLALEQWRALITLHKTLLYEHHDFFLASQHPSASPAISKLAAKYCMPARMWRHGIHAFLEVLRHRLPESLEHMLAFIYIAYSMMALLFETVPAFEDTWIECLGDLGRYRMAIVDDDRSDREVWSGVSKFWYGKAADKSPTVGRLYHHLAILARPQTIQQLSLYTRSLTCISPFENARSSILTLLRPALEVPALSTHRFPSMERAFVRIHAILYLERGPVEVDAALRLLFGGLFDRSIQRLGPRFKDMGVEAAMANACALLQYGAAKSIPLLAFKEARNWAQQTGQAAAEPPSAVDTATPLLNSMPIVAIANLTAMDLESSHSYLSMASHVVFGTLLTALQRPFDRNVYPMIHTYLVLLHGFARVKQAMASIERLVPWTEVTSFLTSLATPDNISMRVIQDAFPRADHGFADRPLPEDFVMRGQYWSDSLYPENWFVDAAVDDEERMLELASMTAPRIERMLWLGVRIARLSHWLSFDESTRTFAVTDVVKEWPLPAMPQIVPATASDKDSIMTGLDDTTADETAATISLPRSSSASPSEDEVESPLKRITLTKKPTILQRQPVKKGVDMTDVFTKVEVPKLLTTGGWSDWKTSPTRNHLPVKVMRLGDVSVLNVNDEEINKTQDPREIYSSRE